MTKLPVPKIENNFSDCVSMTLHFQEVEEQQPFSFFLDKLPLKLKRLILLEKIEKTISNEIDLRLTINFSGEQVIEVPGIVGGEATFGVRRGRLQLELNGCRMPLERTTLNHPFKVSTQVETQTEKGTEVSIGTSIGGSLGGNTGVTGTTSGGFKTGGKSLEKTTLELSQVKQTGSEETPAWIFEVQGSRSVLEGVLKKTKLGTLYLNSIPCVVAANFRVRSEDVRLTWGKIGTVKNVARNKLAVIERALALKYIGPKIESSSLSEIEWRYE